MTTRNSTALTLETVAEHFTQWRVHKKKGERIPEALWQEAITLLAHYPISQVARTLRLGGSDLNNRRRQFASVQAVGSEARQPQSFAEIDLPLRDQGVEQPVTTWLEFQRPDGLRLRVHTAEGAERLALVDRFIGAEAC